MNEKPFLINTIHFLLMSIVFTIPLFFTKQFVFGFTPEKTFLFYLLVEIAFALWLYAVLKQKEYFPPRHPILIAGGIFLLVYTAAGVVGVSPEISFWSSISRMSGLALLYHIGMFTIVLVSTVRDSKTWDKILTAAVSSGAIVALVSYISHFYPEFISISPEAGSTLGNSSFAATYLIFALFMSLLLTARSNGKKRVIFGITSALIILSPNLFSFGGLKDFFDDPFEILGNARAASGAMWVGMFIAGFLLLAGSPKRYLRQIGKTGSTILVALTIISIVSFIIPGSPSRVFLNEQGVSSRFIFWESAIEGIKERPILGWGPENYFVPFYKHFDPALLTEKYAGGLEANTDKPHNTYLEIAVTGGVLSLIAYFALFYYLFSSIVKAWRKNTLPYTTYVAIFAGLLIAYLLEGSFFFDTITSYLAFALVIGYITHKTSEKKDDSYPRISKRVSWPALTTILLVFLLLFNALTYKPYTQQTTLVRIASGMTVVERSRVYEELFALTPHARTSMMIYLMNKMTIGIPEILPDISANEGKLLLEDVQSLRAEVAKYIGDDPKHYRLVLSFIRLLHIEYILQSDAEKQIEVLDISEKYEEKLHELSPDNPQNYWVKAQRELFEGDTDKALELLNEARAKAPEVGATGKFIESVNAHVSGEIFVPLLR